MAGVDSGLTRSMDRSELLRALRAFQRGDYSVRMPAGLTGIDGEIARTFNELVRLNQVLVAEAARADKERARALDEANEIDAYARRRLDEVLYQGRASDL
jgi:hypothetical protein